MTITWKYDNRDVLIVAPHQRSVIAEQIRSIRTNIQVWNGDTDQRQVLLFTSSMSGEGKSFVSMNLGASLALTGQPTVILEMDMRMPRWCCNPSSCGVSWPPTSWGPLPSS